MKQTILIRRVETRIIGLDVAQPLTADTISVMVNEQMLGSPELGAISQHTLTDWQIVRVNPSCECASSIKPKARGRR